MRGILLILLLFYTVNSNASVAMFGLFDSSKDVPEDNIIVVDDKIKSIPVQVFDISGITLGSTYLYIKEDVVKETGYKIVKEETKYPKYFEYNYNYECRKGGKTLSSDQLKKCTRELAIKNKKIYTNYIKLRKDETKEEVEVYFTSNQTGGEAYQIVYTNDADKTEGIGEAYSYQRKEKLRKFLSKIYDKYGQPNIIDKSSGGQIWASKETDPKQPVMRVHYGKIVLEDLSSYENDEVLNKEEAQKAFKSKEYSF